MKALGKMILLIALLSACKKDPVEPIDLPSTDELSMEIACVYVQKIDARFEICKTEDGTHTVLTKANGTDKWWPRHSSARGETLFYQSGNSRDINDYGAASLWKLGVNGESTLLIDQGSNGWDKQGLCNWSHSGEEIVMAAVDSSIGTWQVYITDYNGENPRQITQRNDVDYFDPVFSPDDDKIYCSTIPENEIKINSNIEIMRVDIASGLEERLTYNSFRDHHPDISLDENTLIYESLVDPDYLSIGKWAIKELDLSTSLEKTIVEDDNINLFPRYSTSDNLIYLTELNIESFQMKATVYNTYTNEKTDVNETENITMNPDPF